MEPTNTKGSKAIKALLDQDIFLQNAQAHQESVLRHLRLLICTENSPFMEHPGYTAMLDTAEKCIREEPEKLYHSLLIEIIRSAARRRWVKTFRYKELEASNPNNMLAYCADMLKSDIRGIAYAYQLHSEILYDPYFKDAIAPVKHLLHGCHTESTTDIQTFCTVHTMTKAALRELKNRTESLPTTSDPLFPDEAAKEQRRRQHEFVDLLQRINRDTGILMRHQHIQSVEILDAEKEDADG